MKIPARLGERERNCTLNIHMPLQGVVRDCGRVRIIPNHSLPPFWERDIKCYLEQFVGSIPSCSSGFQLIRKLSQHSLIVYYLQISENSTNIDDQIMITDNYNNMFFLMFKTELLNNFKHPSLSLSLSQTFPLSV